jgi:hypothetical protein
VASRSEPTSRAAAAPSAPAKKKASVAKEEAAADRVAPVLQPGAGAAVGQGGPGADLFAARLSLARANASRGEHSAAAAILSGLVAEQPAHPRAPEAMQLLAQEQSRAGQREVAAQTCAVFLNRYPGDARAPAVAELRAALLEQLGRPDEAHQVREEARRASTRAVPAAVP